VNAIEIVRELREGGITRKTILAAFVAGSLAALVDSAGIHPYRIYAGLPLEGKMSLWSFVSLLLPCFTFWFWRARGGKP